jgi:hypothetical protein
MFKVSPLFNRCLAITLPTGEVVNVKIMGEKGPAAAQAKTLTAALVAAK